ncbi:hypothetical protein [Marinomonas primoryensis]|uniref:Putative transmembrane protein n=1 Tax=Marinomonas primoryensis TaxID=178399 RepID=A0A859CW80_9GAMM|nr:hypothetical protein [Marinomonas primoryensis]QKK80847.1 putative transmembrane protein [Marinomonas primoryensis]
MSGSLRYKNPTICEYLASQYVMSVMSPLVRSRIESLRLNVPELDEAIIRWSESVATLQEDLPEKQPSSHVWKRIERSIFPPSRKIMVDKSWWSSLIFWQVTGVGASLASLILVVALSTNVSKQDMSLPLVSSTPSYTAVMSSNSNGVRESDDIRFVVNVYQKTEAAPSRLFIQWSQMKPRVNNASMHVWAENQNTGELTYIGVEPNEAKVLALSKITWLAVSNSSHLIFTKNESKPTENNTLFSGPCIQLGSWKSEAI